MQAIWEGPVTTEALARECARLGVSRALLVRGRTSFSRLTIRPEIERLPVIRAEFMDFSPNPTMESVVSGMRAFDGCDGILAVGGGSAIDVAKCVKLFIRQPSGAQALSGPFIASEIPLLAIPTTAGTGSESTQFAVVYKEGVKQSVAHPSILPDCAFLDASALSSLPEYQKKCAALDALCQAVESAWSVRSSEESFAFSRRAIPAIRDSLRPYLAGDEGASATLLRAANDAGRAINLTQTTAAHAMSYQITKIFGIPHGGAVALCLPAVWEYMLGHMDRVIDPRGGKYLADRFDAISRLLGFDGPESAVAGFRALVEEMGIAPPDKISRMHMEHLSRSVNPARLRNNPVALSSEALGEIYARIAQCRDNRQ